MRKHALDERLDSERPKKTRVSEKEFSNGTDQQSDEYEAGLEPPTHRTIPLPNEASEVKQNLRILKIFLQDLPETSISSNEKSFKLLQGLFHEGPVRVEPDSFPSVASLLRTWHFAIEHDDIDLAASFASTFALLLRKISKYIEFRNDGNSLCQQLLSADNRVLFNRHLRTAQLRIILVDSAVRLLTEILSFDGGTAAPLLFRHRHITWQGLDNYLTRSNSNPPSDVKQKPSLRETALSFLLANLKFHPPDAKEALLGQASYIRSLFRLLLFDSAQTIRDILAGLRTDVLEDGAIKSSVKLRTFSSANLQSLIPLYNDRRGIDSSHSHTVRDEVHAFFLKAYAKSTFSRTSRHTHGSTYNRIDKTDGDLAIDDADSLQLNSTPSLDFLLKLRPDADTYHAALILSCFENFPVLIEPFFAKSSTVLDSQLTLTWLGQARFLLATILLDVPDLRNQDVPANPEAMARLLLSCALPFPLQRKSIVRKINHKSLMMNFMTVQILVASFRKMQAILISSCLRSKSDYDKTLRLLLSLFVSRVPEMGHVAAQFWKCPPVNVVLQEALASLILLYHTVLPGFAVEAKVDVAEKLTRELDSWMSKRGAQKSSPFSVFKLHHLMTVASLSTDTRWFHDFHNSSCENGGANDYFHAGTSCLLSSVFRAANRYWAHFSLKTVEACLRRLLYNCGLSTYPGSDSLARILSECLSNVRPEQLEDFITLVHHALVRHRKEGVQVYESLVASFSNNSFRQEQSRTGLVIFSIVLMNQWTTVAESHQTRSRNHAASLLGDYLNAAKTQGMPLDISQHLENNFLDMALGEDDRVAFKHSLHATGHNAVFASPTSSPPAIREKLQQGQTGLERYTYDSSISDGSLPLDIPNMSQFAAWKRANIEDAIDDGTIAKFFLCLCSEEVNVRREALRKLQALMNDVLYSTRDEKQQVYLVIGELVETASNMIHTQALPYHIAIAASEFSTVVAQPTHIMFSKVNNFLTRRPSWDIRSFLLKWRDSILLQAPSEDGSYFAELDWFLTLLLRGVGTTPHPGAYNYDKIIYNLLSVTSSASLPIETFDKIIDLLFRYIQGDGGSLLALRYGLISWAVCQLERYGGATKERLIRLYHATAEANVERLETWSSLQKDDMIRAFVRGERALTAQPGTVANIRASA